MKRPTINKIKPDIKNVSIYLRSTKKFGKSTLFRDTILAKYGDPSYGLLIKCGHEDGDKMLDEINSVQVESYQDMLDVRYWLINKVWIERDEKGKVTSKEPLEHNIKIVAFDTVDELCLLTDAETIRQSNIENPNKKIKSIKAAFGGYTAGEKYSANDVIKPYIGSIKKAGFGVWGIAHTKFKQIKEKGGLDEDGYMQLTSNLAADYESAFGDIFDVVLTGVIDKNLEEKKDAKGNVKKDAKGNVKKYAGDEVRKLYFRGTSLIDAGGRFAMGAVPEYMLFDKPDMGEDFVRVVEEGMEKSKKSFNRTATEEVKPVHVPVEIEKVEEPVEIDEELDNTIADIEDDIELEVEEIVDTEQMITEIKTKFKTADKETRTEIKSIIGSKKLTECDVDELKQILAVLA